MAVQTLAQMQLASTENLLATIVDEIINVDPITARIPYETFMGTQKAWLRESTRPTPQFFAIDEELSDGVGTKVEVTLSPVSIGHNATTAGFSRTLDNVFRQRAINVRDGLLGLADVIGDKNIYGNSTTNSKEYNGLHALVPAAQTINEGTTATGAALNLSNVDQGFDLVKKGAVDIISVTRNVHRRISQFVNFSSTNTSIRTAKDDFGVPVFEYNSVGIAKNDRQVQTETIASDTFSAKTGGATSTLFMVQFGMPDTEKPGIFGIQGPNGVEQIPIGWTEKKDNWVDRLIWYPALGLGGTQTVAAIDGITDVAVTA